MKTKKERTVKATLKVIRYSDDTYSAEFDGITRRADLVLLLKMADRFYRRRLSIGFSADENLPLVLTSADYGSPTETGA